MSATPSAISARSQSVPVLLVERNQLTVRSGARRATCIGEQHQREQPGDLGVVRQQRRVRAA